MTKQLIYDARGPVAWFLRWTGMAAITMPWRRIYVLPEFGRHEGLLRHELVHIEQIERDGAWTFTARYLWWLVRYGYWENPYEVDAYGQEPIIEENQYVGWIAEQAEDASAERSGEDAGRGG